jgi:cell division protein FtsI (penicillin-binding protein 3)
MANHPSFDPSQSGRLPADQRRNRAVTDVFEPGSILKPFVWSALSELTVARPQEQIDCTEAGYWVTPYGRVLRDAHGKGTLNWNEVLIQSSNIGMAKVAERVTPLQLHDIVGSFGFGQPTGSGLPGEVSGLVHPLAKWTKYSQSSVPMGQEIGVTALQITRAFCTFANGGMLVTPKVEMAPPSEPPAQIQLRVLSPETAAHTREILRRAVAEGTGRKADSKLYEIFGKTGTAQLPDFDNGGYHQDRYVSSFMGAAPFQQPRLVIGCFIHQPDKRIGHYGGTVAAPAAKKVLEETLLYLGVPPKSQDDAVRQDLRFAGY